jgi:hypothetical protein
MRELFALVRERLIASTPDGGYERGLHGVFWVIVVALNYGGGAVYPF